MPLIECPVCSRNFSAQASTCPGCGHAVAREAHNWDEDPEPWSMEPPQPEEAAESPTFDADATQPFDPLLGLPPQPEEAAESRTFDADATQPFDPLLGLPTQPEEAAESRTIDADAAQPFDPLLGLPTLPSDAAESRSIDADAAQPFDPLLGLPTLPLDAAEFRTIDADAAQPLDPLLGLPTLPLDAAESRTIGVDATQPLDLPGLPGLPGLPTLPSAEARAPYLRVLDTSSGTTHEFEFSEVTIGRDPKSALPVSGEGSEAVSGDHARLIYRDERWWVKDSDSRNGTYLDGRRLERDSFEPVEPDSEIRLSHFGPLLRIQAVAPDEPGDESNTPHRGTDVEGVGGGLLPAWTRLREVWYVAAALIGIFVIWFLVTPSWR